MTIDISMWDEPSEQITASRTREMQTVAVAAAEPMWGYLSEATTPGGFDARLAVARPGIERLVAAVVPENAHEAIEHAVSDLRTRWEAQSATQATAARLRDALKTTAADSIQCVQCALHGMFYCQETVDTCDLCGQRGDVFRYRPEGETPETVCLDCLCDDKHMDSAHTPDWQDPRTASRRTAKWIDQARAIVENKQFRTVTDEGEQVDTPWRGDTIDPNYKGPGIILDGTTASMLVQIYDALGPANRAKFDAMSLTQAVDFGWKLVNKVQSKGSADKTAAGPTLKPDFGGSAYCWYGPGGYYGDLAEEVGWCDGPVYWVEGESPRSAICTKHAKDKGWLSDSKTSAQWTTPSTKCEVCGDPISSAGAGKWQHWKGDPNSPLRTKEHDHEAQPGDDPFGKGKTSSLDRLFTEAADNGWEEGLKRIRESDDHSSLLKMMDQNARLRERLPKDHESLPHLDAQDEEARKRLKTLQGSKSAALCPTCKGSGSHPWDAQKKCPKCKGRGHTIPPKKHRDPDIDYHEGAKTAGIKWKGETHFGVGYLEGKAPNGDIYEVYFNPNSNPTPCTWVNYGPGGDTGPNSGIARGKQFTTMQEAVADAEAHATATKTSAKSDTCPKCGHHMKDVTVHGDTLKAKCDSCGWSGTKTKKTSSAKTYSEYVAWCKEVGFDPMPKDRFEDARAFLDAAERKKKTSAVDELLAFEAANPNFVTPDGCMCPEPRGNDPRGDRRNRKHWEIRDDDHFVAGPFDRKSGGPGSADYTMMQRGEWEGFGSTPNGPGLHMVEVDPGVRQRYYDTFFDQWMEERPASTRVVGSRTADRQFTCPDCGEKIPLGEAFIRGNGSDQKGWCRKCAEKKGWTKGGQKSPVPAPRQEAPGHMHMSPSHASLHTAESLSLDGVDLRLDGDLIGWMSDWGAIHGNDWQGKGWVTSKPHNSGGLGGASYVLTDKGRQQAQKTSSRKQAAVYPCHSCGASMEFNEGKPSQCPECRLKYNKHGVPNYEGSPKSPLTGSAVEALLAEADFDDDEVLGAEAAFYHYPQTPDPTPPGPSRESHDWPSNKDVGRIRDQRRAEEKGEAESSRRHQEYWDAHPAEHEQHMRQNASRTVSEGPTYQVKKVHDPTWLDGGETTEEAMEAIKAGVGDHDEEFWLLRNNFNGWVGVYAYHPAMRGIDQSAQPRPMGSYEQFYGQPYREASRTATRPWATTQAFADGYNDGYMDNAQGRGFQLQNSGRSSESDYAEGYYAGYDGHDAPPREGRRKRAVNENAYGTERYQSQPEVRRPGWITEWSDEETRLTEEQRNTGLHSHTPENPFKDTLTTIRQSALRHMAAEVDDTLEGFAENDPFDDLGQGSQTAYTTRPRVMPHSEPEITNPPVTDPAGGMGSFDADPTLVPNGDYGMDTATMQMSDPMQPTVDQMVAAKISRLAKRVRVDNPSMSPEEARHLAAQTVARYPEMIRQEA